MVAEFKGREIIASSLPATSEAIQKKRAGSPRRAARAMTKLVYVIV
jgi:hypothetical protein